MIEGQRVNQLQQAEPYERTLINHLHIIHNKEFASGGIDPVCADSPNAVVCDGSVRVNCAAGKAEVLGDCGFFGASCGTVGTTAVCLDWECSVASGIACVSSTKATECAFGEVQAELSCNSGMECIMSNGEAQCVDEICKGQDSKWCDGNTLHHCQAALTLDPVTQIKHSTEACSESGKICDPEALVCVDPPPEPTLSCAGACGGQGDGCGCSDACGAAGDCCPDLCTHCSEHPQCQSGEEGPEDEPEEGGASEEEETPESPESSEEGGDESSVEPEPEEESPESSTESSSEEELDWGVDQAGDESSWAVNSGEETEENSDTEILVGESSLQEDEESAGEGKALGLSGTSSGDSEEGGCHSGSSFPFPMPLLLVLAVMGVRRETGIFTDPR